MSPKDADGITCPRCGIPVLGTARFCPSCGAGLATGGAAPPPPTRIRTRRPGDDPMRRVPDAARPPVWRMLGTGLVLVGLAVGGTWLWNHRSELPVALPVLHRPASPVAVTSPTPAPSPSPSPALLPAVVPVPDHWTMCKSVDDKHGPVDPVETYGPHDSFCCSVHFPNMGLGVPIEARWYHETEVLKTTPYLAATDGNVNVSFQLVPGSGWPPGHYSVVIYVARQASATLNFVVVEGGSSTPVATATATLASPLVRAVLCQGLGAGYQPIGPATEFHANDALNCSLELRDAHQGQEFKVRWYNDQHLMKETPHVLKGDMPQGFVGFTVMAPQAWPPGDYHAEILIDGQSVDQLPFKVVP